MSYFCRRKFRWTKHTDTRYKAQNAIVNIRYSGQAEPTLKLCVSFLKISKTGPVDDYSELGN